MHLKDQGKKLGWLKIFLNKVGFAQSGTKMEKWRSAPNFTECPLCFLEVRMDPCRHTRRWIWARAKWLNYCGKTNLKTYYLILLSFSVKELRQAESLKSVHFSWAFIWYQFCCNISKTQEFLLLKCIKAQVTLVGRNSSLIKILEFLRYGNKSGTKWKPLKNGHFCYSQFVSAPLPKSWEKWDNRFSNWFFLNNSAILLEPKFIF